MAHIQPSREPYNPADDLKQAGTFLAVCSDVRQGLENKQYPKQSNIAIEFTVNDSRYPALKGKKTAIVCLESIYISKKDGRKSHLLQYLQQAGIVHPEQGCDPAVLCDKWFMVSTEMYNGKAMVRQIMPMPAPQMDANGNASGIIPPPVDPVQQEQIPF